MKRIKQTKKPTAREVRAARQQAEAQNDPRFRGTSDFSVRHEAPTLTAKNQRQKDALAFLNSGTPIVMLTGSAGTGKSMLAAFRAASQLKSKAIDKIILIRPAVTVGKSVGLLPGEIEEKMAPYFRQTLIHLGKFLGQGHMTYATEKKQIEMFPFEYARGNSFENCIVIVEEAQNLTHEDFELLFTRLGENCQMIFTGDQKQHDLNGESGLTTSLAMVKRMLEVQPWYLDDDDMDELEDGFGIVEFKPEDVVRRGLTRALVKMYYHNN